MPPRDVEFPHAGMNMLVDVFEHLFRRERIGALFIGIAAEMAKRTVRFAHIGEVQAHVLDEIDLFAILALVDHVGQLADGQDVVGLVQKNAVFKRQPFSAHHLVHDLVHSSVPRCDGGEHAPVSSFADRDHKSIIRLAFPSRQHEKKRFRLRHQLVL